LFRRVYALNVVGQMPSELQNLTYLTYLYFYRTPIFCLDDEQIIPCFKFFAVNVLDVSGVVSGTWIKIT
jgi:hypothetical protein